MIPVFLSIDTRAKVVRRYLGRNRTHEARLSKPLDNPVERLEWFRKWPEAKHVAKKP